MKLEIGGQTFTVRDSFEGRDGWLAMRAIQDAWPEDLNDYDAAVRFCTTTITGWSLAGEPSDVAAWEQVDGRIIMRLLRESFDALGEYRKNSPGESTTD